MFHVFCVLPKKSLFNPRLPRFSLKFSSKYSKALILVFNSNFYVWCKIIVEVLFLLYGCPVIAEPLIEKTVLYPISLSLSILFLYYCKWIVSFNFQLFKVYGDKTSVWKIDWRLPKTTSFFFFLKKAILAKL